MARHWHGISVRGWPPQSPPPPPPRRDGDRVRRKEGEGESDDGGVDSQEAKKSGTHTTRK